jgi:beta-glucosidase
MLQSLSLSSRDTVMLAVLAEPPYAEMVGDVNIPYCQGGSKTGCLWFANEYIPAQPSSLELALDDYSRSVVDIVRGKDINIPMVTILLSGRPRLIQPTLQDSQAFVAAFWPGTAGGAALCSALTGAYRFSPAQGNRLSFDWPASMDTLREFPVYWGNGTEPRIEARLFDRGFGLAN